MASCTSADTCRTLRFYSRCWTDGLHRLDPLTLDIWELGEVKEFSEISVFNGDVFNPSPPIEIHHQLIDVSEFDNGRTPTSMIGPVGRVHQGRVGT